MYSKAKSWDFMQNDVAESSRKKRINPIHARIREFFTRDDVSRMTTGKKYYHQVQNQKTKTITTGQHKKLHQKFVSETGMTVSYSLFCKLRPFFVVEPTELDRQTCQRKIHENTKFCADALFKSGVIQSDNLDSLCI